MQSIISADSHLAIWAVLLASSAFGVYAEKKGWIKNIAGVMYTMVITAILSLVHFLPSASGDQDVAVYDFVFDYVTPMAIPMLLFSANIVKIVKESGRLIVIYLLGAVGIVIGAVISYFIVNLGPETYKVAGVFIATLVGGSVNFVAASETLDFSTSSLFTTTMAVDNFGIQFYLIFLFYLPFIKILHKYYPEFTGNNNKNAVVVDKEEKDEKDEKEENKVDIASITYVITIAAVVTVAGYYLAGLLQQLFNTSANLTLLVITILMAILASVFPGILKKLENVAFSMGMSMLYIFLAVVGAASNLKDVFLAGPGIMIFATLTLVIQFIFIMILGKIFKFSLKEIAIASCANVSGPTLSAPMAATFGAKEMVTPAVLVGILGYVIGTLLGVSVGFWLAP
ncbi:MAG: hypothetical protein DRJ10_14350 [Bacteroidetes bacterium]|nr:MAG: hypothetical protein DRJ10_14350 [Bacteroidota bacterium]